MHASIFFYFQFILNPNVLNVNVATYCNLFFSCRSLSNMCYCNAIKSIWIPLRSLFASLCMHTVFIHNAAQKKERKIYYETRKNNHKEPWSNKRKSGTMLFVGLIDRQCSYCFELVVKIFYCGYFSYRVIFNTISIPQQYDEFLSLFCVATFCALNAVLRIKLAVWLHNICKQNERSFKI